MPTANIEPQTEDRDGFVLPPYGVYGGEITIGDDDTPYIALVNIGTRPSDDDDPRPTIEALIQDFEGDIYGSQVTLRLDHFIRGIMKFTGGLDEVRVQIREDVKSYMHMRKDALQEGRI